MLHDERKRFSQLAHTGGEGMQEAIHCLEEPQVSDRKHASDEEELAVVAFLRIAVVVSERKLEVVEELGDSQRQKALGVRLSFLLLLFVVLGRRYGVVRVVCLTAKVRDGENQLEDVASSDQVLGAWEVVLLQQVHGDSGCLGDDGGAISDDGRAQGVDVLAFSRRLKQLEHRLDASAFFLRNVGYDVSVRDLELLTDQPDEFSPARALGSRPIQQVDGIGHGFEEKRKTEERTKVNLPLLGRNGHSFGSIACQNLSTTTPLQLMKQRKEW